MRKNTEVHQSDGNQLTLFNDLNIDRRQMQEALERLDFTEAQRMADRIALEWPGACLEWELDLLDLARAFGRTRIGLDAGYALWQEFASKPLFRKIPAYSRDRLQQSYFFRLLAVNRSLFDWSRTAGGLSIGEFHLLAGQVRSARRFFDREIREFGDSWPLRLKLGNCYVALGDLKGANANYRQAHLQGLHDEAFPDIADLELREFLHAAEQPEWAFCEACVEGLVAAPRFDDRQSVEAFVEEHLQRGRESKAPQRFCACWIVSENKIICSDPLLVQVRKEMTSLHPGLQSRYMRRLSDREA